MSISNPNILSRLTQKIADRSCTVGVIGLGYVGLPLVDTCVQKGFGVIGFDIDPSKTEALNRGESYIGQIDSQVIDEWVDSKRFEATSDMTRLSEADIVLICVPTPLTDSRNPDLNYVESTANNVAHCLRNGQLIVLESTTYPGTTRDVLLPILSQAGMKVGEHFFLAFSPEREDPGNQQFETSKIPKVVGGIESNSTNVAKAFYEATFHEVVPVDNCEIAEACKILENTYRSVNIAMVNELKVLFDKMEIDIWSVIEAAKTKPFGFQAFYPGPGLGGHCIPIDPFYLSWVARKYEMPTKFIELAGEINSAMPQFVMNRLSEALNSQRKPVRGSRVGILGVAYKKDIDDHRESPAFKLMENLVDLGAKISYCDPHVPALPKMRRYNVPDLRTEQPGPEYWSSLDCVLICTDHSLFDWNEIVGHAPLIVDCRNATKYVHEGREKIWMA